MPRWWVADAQAAARQVMEEGRVGGSASGGGGDSSGYSTAVDVAAALPAQYAVRKEALAPPLAAVWQQLGVDADTEAWLETAQPAWWKNFLAAPLAWLGYSGPDVNAMLGTGRMHVLSPAAVAKLTAPHLPALAAPAGAAAGAPHGATLRVLDVGAGSGEVTTALAAGLGAAAGPAVTVHVTATETSEACVASLAAAGFATHGEGSLSGLGPSGTFHVVAALNVLDRAADPVGLLQDALRLLASGGLLLLALVLPWDDFVDVGGRQQPPTAPLPLDGHRCGDGGTLEAAAAAFCSRVLGVGVDGDGASVLPPGAMQLLAATRVPYLAEGDIVNEVYWLPNVILLARKVAP